jgi:hypothetical protein
MESARAQRLGVPARTGRAGARARRACGTSLAACGLIAGLCSAHIARAGVIPSRDKLTDDEKIEILRDLSAEYAKAKTYLPRSKKPLEFDVNGTWDQAKWQMMAQQNGGPAAREGDQIKITHIAFETDKLLVEINGGMKSGGHWYDHVDVGMGGMGGPVSNRGGNPSFGTVIEVNFHKPLENLTAADVKKVLAPLMDFDPHSVSKLYAETLPPEVKKAISEKRAVEGMNHDQVLLALGHPRQKYRETKDGVDLEDWIYGEAPGKVTFVTFSGNKVVKVKEQYAGLGIQTSAQSVTP